MTAHPMPDTYRLDVIGGNGTPFRFVFRPDEGTIRYYDRRYTLTPEQPGYGINHTCEDGQACGPALAHTDFVPHSGYGLRGWNEQDAWDVDRTTMRLVETWIIAVMSGHSAWRTALT